MPDRALDRILDKREILRTANRRRAALVAGGCATYDLGSKGGRRTILCLCCLMESFNQDDVIGRYCAWCNEFHNEEQPE